MERGGLLYSANQQTFLVYLLWVDIELGCEGAAEGLEERYCCGLKKTSKHVTRTLSLNGFWRGLV